MGLAGRIGGWLGCSGVFLVVAAFICERTGARAVIGGSSVNTHVTATWVLACLGLVLLGNGIALLVFASEKQSSSSIPEDTLLERRRKKPDAE